MCFVSWWSGAGLGEKSANEAGNAVLACGRWVLMYCSGAAGSTWDVFISTWDVFISLFRASWHGLVLAAAVGWCFVTHLGVPYQNRWYKINVKDETGRRNVSLYMGQYLSHGLWKWWWGFLVLVFVFKHISQGPLWSVVALLIGLVAVQLYLWRHLQPVLLVSSLWFPLWFPVLSSTQTVKEAAKHHLMLKGISLIKHLDLFCFYMIVLNTCS